MDLTNRLSTDTQAILLLCAHFGTTNQNGLKPLTNTEYNALAQVLQRQKLRPGDLFNQAVIGALESHFNNGLESGRVEGLLARGALLAFKVEEWINQGLWIISRGDGHYPQRLKAKLRHQAPPLLYGIGDAGLLEQGGLAIVGSRDIDDEEADYTRHVSELCAQRRITVISGGAKGADQAGMLSALAAEGKSIGIMANDLARASTMKKYREAILAGQLVLISPYDPQAGFQVGNAMGRNKLIYALADQALVVRSAYQSGGTWAGALEELRRENACPVWVRITGRSEEGNKKLIELGAKALWDEQVSQALFDLNFQDEFAMTPSIAPSVDDEGSMALSMPLESPSGELSGAVAVNEPHLRADATTLFNVILPILLEYLKMPRKTYKEIATHFELQPNQVKEWLNKMMGMNLIEKSKDGYCLIKEDKSSEQLSLSLEANRSSK